MFRFLRVFAILTMIAAVPAQAQVFEVPVLEPGFDQPREHVATGEGEEVQFHSHVFDAERALFVYLPPQYHDDPQARFPLLILRHGGGFDADGWVAQGAAPTILDNLIAEGRAVPMIVAMPASWMPGELGQPFGAESTRATADEMFNDILPVLKERYRIAEGAENLALAGLSAGGGQSYFAGVANAERLGALGVFSTGAFGGIDYEAMARMMENPPPSLTPPDGLAMPPAPEPFDAERDLGPAQQRADILNRQFAPFYISIGDADSRYEATAAAVTSLRESGINIVATQQSGGHVWAVWRQALADFAPRLFRR